MGKLEADRNWPSRLNGSLDSLPVQLLICMLAGLLLRFPAFGNPNIHVDEVFYQFVGLEMHKGMLPYVDIWDRKPLGLFLIYYLVGFVTSSVYGYQILAWLCASLTACVIVRMAALWCNARGAIMAGVVYLAAMLPFSGIGGQSPVFYNLPMALAAYWIARSLPSLREGTIPLRVYGAMALCGIAIIIKQTTLFESLFFGLWSLWLLWKSGKPIPWAKVALMVALGALPTLIIAAFYFGIGDWSDYWNAMVVSNLRKHPSATYWFWLRTYLMTMFLAPIMAPAFLALVLSRGDRGFAEYRRFLLGWLPAALIGFFSVPNSYDHYALPLLVPICVAGASFYARGLIGSVVFVIAVAMNLLMARGYSLRETNRTIHAMDHLAHTIRQHDHGNGLLVFDGPVGLYTMTGSRSLSPLVFPNHLNHLIERNVSQFNTARQIRRIIAQRPDSVVVETVPRNLPVNLDSRRVVFTYIAFNCRLLDRQIVPEVRYTADVLVFGDCNRGPRLAAYFR